MTTLHDQLKLRSVLNLLLKRLQSKHKNWCTIYNDRLGNTNVAYCHICSIWFIISNIGIDAIATSKIIEDHGMIHLKEYNLLAFI